MWLGLNLSLVEALGEEFSSSPCMYGSGVS